MPASLTEFLTIGGVSIVLGFFQSYIVEFIPAWANISPQWKRVIMAVIAIALAIIVQAINVYVPDAVLTDLNPWYIMIVAGLQLATAETTHQKTASASQEGA